MIREGTYIATYKEHHFWELQRRESLNSNLTFLVGIVTLLTGATFAMAKDISWPCGFFNSIFLLGLSIAALLLLSSMYLIARAYMGYKYAHSPDALEILNYKKSLRKRNKEAGMTADEADKEFFDYLDERYAEDASWNKKRNETKVKWIYYANRAVASALISIAVSGIAYIFR